MNEERDRYDHKKIEAKWQKVWEEQGTNKQEADPKKEKCYVLDMFPYPSGEGLHVGHPKGYIATDVYSRYMRMHGKAILHPMGWDGFGLPAENYAIKNKVHPRVAVEKNIARFKEQLSIIGLNYDWSREINTTDPEYYKWTQWIFLQLYKKGLAYESNEPINWCPSCQTGLANEDLENGKCERCGSVVEKRRIRQWVLAITKYADRLLADLDAVEAGDKADVEFVPGAVPLFIDKSGQGAVKEGVELVERQAIAAIVKHWSEDKYIGLKWKKVDWQTLITGGVEEGQTPLEAAIAEIKEETGYQHPVFKRSLGLVDSKFYHVPKKVNRLAHFEVMYFELSDDAKEEITAAEKANHEVHWLTREEMSAFISPDAQKYIWNTLFLGKPTEYKPSAPLLDWPESIKEQQRSWIGRSQGLVFKHKVRDSKIEFETFSAHYEHSYADSFIAIAPDHPILTDLIKGVPSEDKIRTKIEEINIARLSDKHRTAGKGGEMDGVFTGQYAIDPLTGADMPIWVANFVLSDYGTGIVRASQFDERDLAFANKFGIPLREGSVKIDGDYLVENGHAKRATMYRLRDWVFSRQRYWGEPIPLVHCPKDGVVPVPEEELPVKLPEVKHYEPTGTGESPLAAIEEWVNVKCPKCCGAAKRETNTMPQWAGSCWYYLAYFAGEDLRLPVSKENWKKAFASEDYWLPIDLYVGGAEHATRHLIYARFWHKFLFDVGLVKSLEPFHSLKSVGLILATDGRKMSKRFGNVVNPDDVVERWGADTFRVYEMFLGPFSNTASWNDDAIIGPRRFLEKVWRLQEKVGEAEPIPGLGKVASDVAADIEGFKFNTAIPRLMTLANTLDGHNKISKSDLEAYLKLLAPFAPHIAEEIWRSLGNETSIYLASWPDLAVSNETAGILKIPIQINGRVRGSIIVGPEASEAEIREAVSANPELSKWLEGKPISKFIYKPGKIVSAST